VAVTLHHVHTETVTCTESDWKSVSPTIHVVPAATPVTTPLAETVAVAGDREVQRRLRVVLVPALPWVTLHVVDEVCPGTSVTAFGDVTATAVASGWSSLHALLALRGRTAMLSTHAVGPPL
jgi:hypothetical protein